MACEVEISQLAMQHMPMSAVAPIMHYNITDLALPVFFHIFYASGYIFANSVKVNVNALHER